MLSVRGATELRVVLTCLTKHVAELLHSGIRSRHCVGLSACVWVDWWQVYKLCFWKAVAINIRKIYGLLLPVWKGGGQVD